MQAATQPAILTEADILAALRDCYHPAIPLNIVDLSLVQSISIAPDPEAPGAGIPGVPSRHRVTIAIVLPESESDSEVSPIPAQIQNRLTAFETISRTEIDLRSHPVWTPDCISPEGRQRLATLASTQRKSTNGLVQITAQTKT